MRLSDFCGTAGRCRGSGGKQMNPKGDVQPMKLQQLMSYVRRAIDDYGMIEDGDRIAVGIS